MYPKLKGEMNNKDIRNSQSEVEIPELNSEDVLQYNEQNLFSTYDLT